MSYALGLDASTQSCSALVIDPAAGTIVAEATVNFGERLPEYQAPSGFIPGGTGGEVHADPRMWLDALELLLAELSTRCELGKVAAVSGAGQQHGSVYLNDRWHATIAALDPSRALAEQIAPCLSRATSPIWMDGSTGEECREIAAAIGGDPEVCSRSGSVAIERFTGPQIRRFSKLDPAGYAATSRIHLVSSFLASVLCGRDAGIDHGDGAGMNLLDVHEWDWDPGLLDATAAGLRDKLPPALPCDSVVGSVSPWFQQRFGFAAGVPVTIFTGDNPSSLVGMGASRPGRVVVSLGTSDTFFAAMPGVVTDPDGCGHVFGNPAGGAMSLQCFINGSLAREAVRDRLGMDWDQFSRALEETPPGNDDQVMIPFFRPEISPKVDTGGPLMHGESAFENWQQPARAVRACIEGQFVNMKARSRWMKLAPEVIYLTGGASANDAIAQVAADVFAAEVRRLEVSGSVALGAAMRAAAGSLGTTLEELEAAFHPQAADAAIQPREGIDYEPHEAAMEALLS